MTNSVPQLCSQTRDNLRLRGDVITTLKTKLIDFFFCLFLLGCLFFTLFFTCFFLSLFVFSSLTLFPFFPYLSIFHSSFALHIFLLSSFYPCPPPIFSSLFHLSSSPSQSILSKMEQAVQEEVPGGGQIAGFLLAGHLPGFPQHSHHRL